VHAFAQNGLGGSTVGGALVFRGEMGLHGVLKCWGQRWLTTRKLRSVPQVLPLGVETAAVENARRIKLGFEALVNPVQGRF